MREIIIDMPTSKKRLNLTLDEGLEKAIEALATRDKVSDSSKAVELIKIGLELEEDDLLDEIASKRDIANAKFLPHDKAWE